MTIQTFSPLQGSGLYYLNSESFDSTLMFTDTNTVINYIICRLDSSGVWNIIANGKLNGYNDGTVNLQYKFDFNNYIKINQEKNPVLVPFSTGTAGLKYVFNSLPTSLVSIVLSTSDILTVNAAKITVKSNGEIVLSGVNTPSTLTATVGSYDYDFRDKVDGTDCILTSSPTIKTDSYFTVSINSGTTFNLTGRDSANNSVVVFSRTSTVNCENYLIYIPANCVRIEYQINALPVEVINTITNDCSTQLFYYGINGGFDMLYLDGNTHEVNSVTKEYITVNNKKLPIKIINNKQFKANTGFKLNQSQIYSLIKTPYVFTISSILLKRYILDTTTFDLFL